ncbi:hypothetical protein ES707_00241 [subsurface metagenome]
MAGPAGGNQGAGGSLLSHQLNLSRHPSRTGALGLIGLSGRAH